MRPLLLAVLLVTTGCSLIFDPDGLRLHTTGGPDGGAPDGGTCASACVLPEPTCQGSTLLVPSDPFCRDDGRCAWSTSQTPCPQGCADGACIGEPCLGVRCDSPPANACADATHLKSYASTGTCSDGACTYAATTTACPGGCADGRCKDDPCAGVSCQSPPPPVCVNSVDSTLRTWAGTCQDGTCSYESTDTPCPSGCANGACVTPACNSSNCTGCCAGSTCVPVASESADQCGQSGLACGACGSGYTCWNGSCVDLDECVTANGGCSADATCTNTPGGRTCTCRYGFAGDGVTCTDVRGRLSAGGHHTCAVGSDGQVRCWGSNDYGQLCDSSTGAFSVPSPNVAAELGTGVLQVSAGSRFTCAVTGSGAVKCCGSNASGQLGTHSVSYSRTAVTAVSSGIVAVAAGDSHVCALTSGGGVECWGADSNGQLGNNATAASLGPMAVTGLSSGVTAVAAGSFHSCALLANGTVKCWGWNDEGQLGDGSTNQRLAPVPVTGLSGVTVVAIDARQRNTCALSSTGRVYCWGDNSSHQLGDPSLANDETPLPVSGLSDAQAASVGGTILTDGTPRDFTCAVTGAGGYACWGNNDNGHLGDGTPTSHATPAPETNLAAPIALFDCGDEHCCAMTVAGERWCWGLNGDGQLGNNSQASSSVPVPVGSF